MSGETLSAYELERLANIKRNQKVLVELGLEPKTPLRKKLAPVKRAKKEVDPDYAPERRATRVSSGRGKSARDAHNNSDSDSEDEDAVQIRRPHKIVKRPEMPTLEVAATDGMLQECIVVEAAKTSRSKCRGCFEMLEQGELRVGMESWMVGRQVMVWQHPRCFWKGLALTAEPTGRGKCKASKANFAAGEMRLSAQAHTTTSHFKLSCAHAAVLQRVQSADMKACDVSAIEGFKSLGEDEKSILLGSSTSPRAPVPIVDPTPEAEETLRSDDLLKTETEGEETKQPPKGSVKKAKGKVCWRFAGHLCYGSLLPGQETKTHCYARTHKGNTKTLTKGGASWWLVGG